jgi:hypothetical protein
VIGKVAREKGLLAHFFPQTIPYGVLEMKGRLLCGDLVRLVRLVRTFFQRLFRCISQATSGRDAAIDFISKSLP